MKIVTNQETFFLTELLRYDAETTSSGEQCQPINRTFLICTRSIKSEAVDS